MQLNFPKNTSGKGGESALRQKQSENNLYLEGKKICKTDGVRSFQLCHWGLQLVSASFWILSGGYNFIEKTDSSIGVFLWNLRGF